MKDSSFVGGGSIGVVYPEKIEDLLSKAKEQSTCPKHPIGVFAQVRNNGRFVLGWNGHPGEKEDHNECYPCYRKNQKSGEGYGANICPSVHAERRTI